ncbi:MAG: glycosyltransferase [Treponema sp.]|jgi:cellulose synthase/poly-beta-1,6-N-acetylglucosamine synthase-like glycosyltransferase|nr:glycosyltransferase [Treponema sp.]
MDWFDGFRLGCFVFAALFHGAIWGGLIKTWLRERRVTKGEGSTPLVSVIVPVHNEAACLPALLESLEKQDYPAVEYVFIDDRSADGSGAIISRFMGGRARLLTLRENPGANRKQYALDRGIEEAAGELLLFIDGDCEAPPSWIRTMVSRMADRATGLCLGPVFKKGGERGFLPLYQCFDHAVRYLYLAASAGLDAAGGGFGNNLILRREALDAIGGYGRLPPSATEDAALIAGIRRGSGYHVRAVCDSGAAVMTRQEPSWKRLVNQTLRWNNGGLFSPDWTTRINFTILMLIIASGVVTVPFLPFCPGLWVFPAMVLFGMTLNTIAALRLFGASMPRAGAAYILQVLFIPCYFTFLTALGFLGVKAGWEGTGHLANGD